MLALTLALALTACRDTERDAFIQRCKSHIERQLRSPSEATYTSIAQAAATRVITLDRDGYSGGENSKLWFVTVDAPNAFGTPVRSYALCLDNTTQGFDLILTSNVNEIAWMLD